MVVCDPIADGHDRSQRVRDPSMDVTAVCCLVGHIGDGRQRSIIDQRTDNAPPSGPNYRSKAVTVHEGTVANGLSATSA